MALTRRTLLASAAAEPLVPLATQAPAGGHAAAPTQKARTFTVGDFAVTTLLAGTGQRDEPQGTFGMNVSAEEFARVSEENFISADTYQGFFNPVVVQTGSETILFDTGLPGDGVPSALAEVGLSPADLAHDAGSDRSEFRGWPARVRQRLHRRAGCDTPRRRCDWPVRAWPCERHATGSELCHRYGTG